MAIDFTKFSEQNSGPVSPESIQGGIAQEAGVSVEDNPYPKDSVEHIEWEHGWCDAEGYDDYTHSRIDM